MQSHVRGTLYILTSNITFCCMACLVRYASSCSPYTSTLYRCIIGMGVIGILALTGRVNLTFNNKKGLLVRGVLGGIAICTGFISITKLGLVKASVIVNSYPIFATVFSFILLKERIHIVKVVAIVLSFAGMIVIVTDKNGFGKTLFSVGGYEIISIAGAILGGLAVVYVKKLQETDSTASIFFSQCLMGFWIVLIPAGNSTATSTGMQNVLILLSIGVLASAGQLIFTEGYRYISVATGSLLVMISPVLNFMAGVLLFHEQIRITTILGAIITLSACMVLLFPDQKRSAVV